MSNNVFHNYEAEVASIFGKKPQKGCAINASENPAKVICDKDMLQLYKALDCPGWKDCKGANWAWRDSAPNHTTKTDEVKLERTIINQAKLPREWTCQMSTSSGIQGPYKHKRRAIDLVRRRPDNCYDFIELKVESDNPLYAIFEILGYALAYVHARKNNTTGSGTYDVMRADKINLVVLGPHNWYNYKKRGKTGERCEFKFDQMADSLGKALNKLTRDQLLHKDDLFSFSFQKFAWDSENIETSVQSIYSL